MSLHVSPPIEAIAVNHRAGEMLSARANAARSFGALPALTLPADQLSVRLGHMGVVIAVSAPGQALPAGVEFEAGEAVTEAADTIQLQVDPSDFSRLAGVLVENGADEAGLSRSSDPVIRRLSRALNAAERSNKEFGGLYADALRLAIVTRLLGTSASGDCMEEVDFTSVDDAVETARQPRRPKSGLPKWRFKRVAAYVEENLAEPITLADMASAAGLSRMHFAAQFRVATGMRPHEYLLRQRIERAQKMLVESRDSLVEIALGVGFQTQAHFTTVFRRFVGDTPYQWRCANRARN
ncbi:helix-turn-helix domain-containing protein [Ancylobacter sp. VNQ12]|uniref:helix-turn-helix domain-containing protein n=1 Tax=Ancylobacter sp. VNQ12 TaxID=3400920 RepID=UPI003C0AA70C